MGLRFRQSIRLAKGLRLNLSKGGASLSVGGRGLTQNFSSRGVRTTFGIPGTGLSYSTSTRGRGRAAKGSAVGGLVLLLVILAVLGAVLR